MHIRNILLKITIPISKVMSKMAKPECLVTSEQFLDIKSKIQDGDVLCSYVGWEVSNDFIPGIFKHCGIYLNGYVYEATTHGTRKVLLEEFFFKKDKIGIARRKGGLTIEQIVKGLALMNQNLNEPYDWSFGIEGVSTWYFSKWCRMFFIAGDPNFEQSFVLRKVFDEPTVTPSDFWLADKFFIQVASYNLESK